MTDQTDTYTKGEPVCVRDVHRDLSIATIDALDHCPFTGEVTYRIKLATGHTIHRKAGSLARFAD